MPVDALEGRLSLAGSDGGADCSMLQYVRAFEQCAWRVGLILTGLSQQPMLQSGLPLPARKLMLKPITIRIVVSLFMVFSLLKFTIFTT